MQFARCEEARFHKFRNLAHAVNVFRDPEERVQIAEPTLAFLDVGFDQISGIAGFLDAHVALGELGYDEFPRGEANDLLVEPASQQIEQLFVAQDQPRFQHRGPDRDVLLRLAKAFIDRAGGVSDLLLQIPKHVEHGLDDTLAPRGLLVGKQKKQVYVGPRRQCRPAITADGQHGQPFRRRWVFRRIHMARDISVNRADDVVFKPRQPRRAVEALATRLQRSPRFVAAGFERAPQPLDHRLALIASRSLVRPAQPVDVVVQQSDIDGFLRSSGGSRDSIGEWRSKRQHIHRDSPAVV